MNGVSTYQDSSISTQSKGRLIVLLYDGAIKFLKLAITELENNNYESKGRYISRAIDIVNELNAVLNLEEGGEIAHNLRRIYTFINTRLLEANMRKDTHMIKDVITILEELNQSWRAISN